MQLHGCSPPGSGLSGPGGAAGGAAGGAGRSWAASCLLRTAAGLRALAGCLTVPSTGLFWAADSPLLARRRFDLARLAGPPPPLGVLREQPAAQSSTGDGLTDGSQLAN